MNFSLRRNASTYAENEVRNANSIMDQSYLVEVKKKTKTKSGKIKIYKSWKLNIKPKFKVKSKLWLKLIVHDENETFRVEFSEVKERFTTEFECARKVFQNRSSSGSITYYCCIPKKLVLIFKKALIKIEGSSVIFRY